MRQGHATKGKKQVGTLACDRRPPIRRSDGEHQALDTLIADAAEMRGELIRAELFAATIQQNGICRSATRLAIQPAEQRRLRIEHLRVARDVSCGALYIVGDQAFGRLCLRAAAAWRDGSESDLHLLNRRVLSPRFVTGVPLLRHGIPTSITELVDSASQLSNIS